jgi:hypothetical protein
VHSRWGSRLRLAFRRLDPVEISWAE